MIYKLKNYWDDIFMIINIEKIKKNFKKIK